MRHFDWMQLFFLFCENILAMQAAVLVALCNLLRVRGPNLTLHDVMWDKLFMEKNNKMAFLWRFSTPKTTEMFIFLFCRNLDEHSKHGLRTLG